MTVAKIDTSVN